MCLAGGRRFGAALCPCSSCARVAAVPVLLQPCPASRSAARCRWQLPQPAGTGTGAHVRAAVPGSAGRRRAAMARLGCQVVTHYFLWLSSLTNSFHGLRCSLSAGGRPPSTGFPAQHGCPRQPRLCRHPGVRVPAQHPLPLAPLQPRPPCAGRALDIWLDLGGEEVIQAVLLS